jgi:phosphate-selective porin OprO/OprP
MSKFQKLVAARLVLLATVWWLLGSSGVLAQEADPSQAPMGPPPLPAASAPVVAATSREAQLEERVRQLEAMVSQLSQQMSQMVPVNGGNGNAPAGRIPGSTTSPDRTEPPGGTPGTSGPETFAFARNDSHKPNTLLSPGMSLNPPGLPQFNAPPTTPRTGAKVSFGPGFEIMSEDEEFVWQFHDLTQFDYRGYLRGGQSLVKDTFAFPRQWFIFNGRITREIGYYLSLAEAFDTVNILDVFIDFAYDARLQIRAGRWKTPFTYEFYAEPLQGTILPEFSLGFNNFGLNRDDGVMAFGRIFANTFDYNIGIFNGARNGLLAVQDSKYVAGLINWHPFDARSDTLVSNLNLGGSVLAGNNSQPPVPAIFRTVVPTTGNSTLGVPFLALSSKTMESGPMAFWDAHVAWFYRQLAVISEYMGGYQDYALNTNQATRTMHTRVPVQTFYVQASFLLTGETRSNVGMVRPFSPFNLKHGKEGCGAWELFARYNYLDIGSQVFTNGIASPDGNANRVSMTDVGCNWYLTQWTKLVFDWNHADFNNPVRYAPHKTQLNSNLLWARIELYF